MTSARLKLSEGMQFVGETESGHALVLDGSAEVGGKNTGPKPMELLLLALGGCTGMDVISILRKKKQPITSFEVLVNGDRAEDHPQKYTKIRLEYIVRGKGIDENAVKRAIELSQDKYCAVKGTLLGHPEIVYTQRIEEE